MWPEIVHVISKFRVYPARHFYTVQLYWELVNGTYVCNIKPFDKLFYCNTWKAVQPTLNNCFSRSWTFFLSICTSVLNPSISNVLLPSSASYLGNIRQLEYFDLASTSVIRKTASLNDETWKVFILLHLEFIVVSRFVIWEVRSLNKDRETSFSSFTLQSSSSSVKHCSRYMSQSLLAWMVAQHEVSRQSGIYSVFQGFIQFLTS